MQHHYPASYETLSQRCLSAISRIVFFYVIGLEGPSLFSVSLPIFPARQPHIHSNARIRSNPAAVTHLSVKQTLPGRQRAQSRQIAQQLIWGPDISPSSKNVLTTLSVEVLTVSRHVTTSTRQTPSQFKAASGPC
jgi:hypothetical protein